MSRKTAAELVVEGRRHVFYIPVDSYVEGAGYRVSVVFEGEGGHYPTGDWPYHGRPGQVCPWFWGHDYETAKRIAEEENQKRFGISPGDAAMLVLRSMALDTRPEIPPPPSR